FIIAKNLQEYPVRVDLLGVPFTVFSDHRTLENFAEQKHLSRRQARWQEFLSQYDFKIVYILGKDNAPADAMSRKPQSSSPTRHPETTASILRVHPEPQWLETVKQGYSSDTWCTRLLSSLWDPVAQSAVGPNALGVTAEDALHRGWLNGRERYGVCVRAGLLYIGERLVIPRIAALREDVFALAHDALGHWGTEKSYAAIRASYYWPNMRKELETLYVPACPLPEDEGFNCILTITDRIGADLRIIPCRADLSAKELATLFFRHWYCKNGLPLEVVSDRDKLFMSKFWKALHRLTGVKLKMSTLFHPDTDGSSGRSNRTIIQALRYHVERNQKGWVRALPLVRFNHMNTINALTGFTPFQLLFGRHPRVILPLVSNPETNTPAETFDANKFLSRLDADVMEAQDNLLLAKSNQAYHADKSRGLEHVYKVGDKVLLSTFHC
ncbi:hypothetical protein PHLCEN_2v3941, partial [Hermanssonia centrifuga]